MFLSEWHYRMSLIAICTSISITMYYVCTCVVYNTYVMCCIYCTYYLTYDIQRSVIYFYCTQCTQCNSEVLFVV